MIGNAIVSDAFGRGGTLRGKETADRTELNMKTTRETKWKLAAAAMVVALAALTVQVWSARSDARQCAALARAAVAQMQQQAQGNGTFLVAKNVPVPCFW